LQATWGVPGVKTIANQPNPCFNNHSLPITTSSYRNEKEGINAMGKTYETAHAENDYGDACTVHEQEVAD